MTDILEIAKECDGFKHEYRPTVICFYAEDFIKFAQRIEQPLQHRINELIFDVAHQQRQIAELEKQVEQLRDELETERDEVQSLESDIAGYENDEIKLNEQIEQLREALQNLIDCAIHGYDMSEDHNYIVNARQALEGK